MYYSKPAAMEMHMKLAMTQHVSDGLTSHMT